MNGGTHTLTYSHKDIFERVMLFEFDRMEFGPFSGSSPNVDWRVTDMNRDFKAFPTYPSHLIVPNGITDEELIGVAAFRSFRRIPAIVWRSRETGCIISRSSQPEIGWFGWRSSVDEKMISEITASSSASKLLILDARSYAAAVANRAKGGGCECNEYYPSAEVQFMGLANIHSIRKSFQSIRYLCQFPSSDPSNWSNQIDSSRWLHHISGLIKSSLLVVNAVRLENKSVLVHCSDGWDRTPQITALSQLLLDSFYRSTKGFLLLIQKEWLEFGHKFYDRGSIIDDPNERCPVFLQWMDCVHQIVKQFPSAFEFNMQFLVSID
jgi:myotubularin-related protein 3/4